MTDSAPPLPDGVPFLPRGVRLHHCQIRRGWFLLAPERALRLDKIGLQILRALDGTRDFSALIDHLSTLFDAPKAQIGRDAARFLEGLRQRRMLELR